MGLRHFLTLKDYSTLEIKTLIKNAIKIKSIVKSGQHSLALQSKTLGLIFSKRSTRTRISSETGWAWYGGNSLFLGNDDIQLGAGEPMQDTSKVVSSFVDCILARLGPHSDIIELAKYSKVPVINALTDTYHPLQALADIMTLVETFDPSKEVQLPSLHVAWVGDANNVLNSLLCSLPRLGIKMSVATPKSHLVSRDILEYANSTCSTPIHWTHSPLEAVHNADVIITDTWISMGMESEKRQRLQDFAGFQITMEMARKGGAKPHWKFMHCLPRKSQEVSDQVFYDPQRSLVWNEAENRKYTVMAVYEYLLKI